PGVDVPSDCRSNGLIRSFEKRRRFQPLKRIQRRDSGPAAATGEHARAAPPVQYLDDVFIVRREKSPMDGEELRQLLSGRLQGVPSPGCEIKFLDCFPLAQVKKTVEQFRIGTASCFPQGAKRRAFLSRIAVWILNNIPAVALRIPAGRRGAESEKTAVGGRIAIAQIQPESAFTPAMGDDRQLGNALCFQAFHGDFKELFYLQNIGGGFGAPGAD